MPWTDEKDHVSATMTAVKVVALVASASFVGACGLLSNLGNSSDSLPATDLGSGSELRCSTTDEAREICVTDGRELATFNQWFEDIRSWRECGETFEDLWLRAFKDPAECCTPPGAELVACIAWCAVPAEDLPCFECVLNAVYGDHPQCAADDDCADGTPQRACISGVCRRPYEDYITESARAACPDVSESALRSLIDEVGIVRGTRPCGSGGPVIGRLELPEGVSFDCLQTVMEEVIRIGS